MTLLFVILIILACVVLSLIVLVQNPKGGGLAGNIAGFSNQFMGVKQTTDVLEKGTWVFAGVIAILCIVSTLFISGGEAVQNRLDNVGGTQLPVTPNAQPQNNATQFPAQQPAAPSDTNK